MLKESLSEFRKLKNMVYIAMLCALNVVLSYFSIPLGPELKIGLSFLTMTVIGYLYGPAVGGICGLILDQVKFLVNPSGDYLLIWSIIEISAGFLYGLILYKKKPSVSRCFVAKLLVSLLCNILLTPLLLTVLYGGGMAGFITRISARLLKNVLLLPIETGIMFILLSRLEVYFRKDA